MGARVGEEALNTGFGFYLLFEGFVLGVLFVWRKPETWNWNLGEVLLRGGLVGVGFSFLVFVGWFGWDGLGLEAAI